MKFVRLVAFFDELGLLLVAHYSMFALFAIFVRPETLKVTGLHETIGPCNETSPLYTVSGNVRIRRHLIRRKLVYELHI